jgi:hypothetical protein
MSNYNTQVSNRAAQNKAGASAYSKDKLLREGAYAQTARQGGFFGIAKREKEFARKQGVSENKQVVKDRITQSRADRSQTIKGGAFGASFLAPLIGSAVGQSIGGKGGRIAESAGQGLGIAAVGLAIGGIAAPIAAAVGGFKLLSTVTEELFGNFKELNVKLTDEILQKQKEGKAGETYLQAQFDFNRALEDGDQSLIERSRKNLETAGGSLTGDFTSLLSITDPEKLASAYEKLTESSERSQSAILSMVTANDLVEKSYNGLEKFLILFGGSKKTLDKNAAKPLVDSVVNSIDLTKVSESLPGLQSDFIKNGDFSKIESAISSLVPNFDILTTQLEGGSEALALLIFQTLVSKDTTKKFSDAQAKLAISTRQLTNNFEKAISRSFGKTAKENEAAGAGFKSRLAVAGVFEGNGSEMQQIQESFARGLAEIAVSASEEQLGSKLDTKVGIAKTIKDAAKNSEQQAKTSKFLERFTSDQYNLDNLGGDLKTLGIDEVAIKAVTKSMEGFAEELDKSRTKADLAKISLKALADAQLKNAVRNTFGNIDEDQSEPISLLSAGKAAERAFKARQRKRAEGKLTEVQAKMTEAEGRTIRKAVQSQSLLGREGEISDSTQILATKTVAENVNQKQASSIIGDEITNLLGGDQFRYQNPSSKAINAATGKKIQDSVLKGDFEKASSLVSNLIGVMEKDMKNLLSSISDEATRNKIAEPLANLEVENAMHLKQIAEYTEIMAKADSTTKDIANVKPEDISLSDQTKGFERDSRIAELTKVLETYTVDLKKIRDERATLITSSSLISKAIIDPLEPGKKTQEQIKQNERTRISEDEAYTIRKAYEVPGGVTERMGFLEKNLPSGRFDQLKPGLLQTLRPSLDKDLSQLNLQEGAIKSFQGKYEAEKKSLEEFQKEPESPTKTIEATSPLPTQTPLVAEVIPKIISDAKGDPKLLDELYKKKQSFVEADSKYKSSKFDDEQDIKRYRAFEDVIDSGASDEGPSKFAKKFGGGKGSTVSKMEAAIIYRTSLDGGNTPLEQEDYLKKNLGASRYREVKDGLLKDLSIPSGGDDLTNKMYLDKEDRDYKFKQMNDAAEAYEKSKLTDAAASIEVSAATFKAGVDAFSQGTNQTLTAQFNVNFTGADFANDPKVAADLTASIKAAWQNWVEESSGKRPVMAPGTQTVTAIA